jgi:hypothetical protein
MKAMKYILKSEEALLFVLSLYVFHLFHFSWTWYFVFILLPDLSMLGYLANTKIGAHIYNLAHHKGLAVITFLAGMYFQISGLEFAGLILFSHSSMDRIFGYGLKFTDSFRNTHLGAIGNSK